MYLTTTETQYQQAGSENKIENIISVWPPEFFIQIQMIGQKNSKYSKNYVKNWWFFVSTTVNIEFGTKSTTQFNFYRRFGSYT